MTRGLPSEYRNIFNVCLRNARARGIAFELSLDDFFCIVRESGNRCSLTGIAFDFCKHKKIKRRPWAASLDRIDSEKGYSKGNCRLVCVAANLAMNAWGESVLKKLSAAYCRNRKVRPSLDKEEDMEEIYNATSFLKSEVVVLRKKFIENAENHKRENENIFEDLRIVLNILDNTLDYAVVQDEFWEYLKKKGFLFTRTQIASAFIVSYPLVCQLSTKTAREEYKIRNIDNDKSKLLLALLCSEVHWFCGKGYRYYYIFPLLCAHLRWSGANYDLEQARLFLQSVRKGVLSGAVKSRP